MTMMKYMRLKNNMYQLKEVNLCLKYETHLSKMHNNNFPIRLVVAYTNILLIINNATI